MSMNKENLAPLEGSEKQIDWAKRIRMESILKIKEEKRVLSSELNRFSEKLEKKFNKKLYDRAEYLRRSIKACDRAVAGISRCRSASDLIKTRPDPSNGLSKNWVNIAIQAQSILDGDLDMISSIRSQPFFLSLTKSECIVLGYDFQAIKQIVSTK